MSLYRDLSCATSRQQKYANTALTLWFSAHMQKEAISSGYANQRLGMKPSLFKRAPNRAPLRSPFGYGDIQLAGFVYYLRGNSAPFSSTLHV